MIYKLTLTNELGETLDYWFPSYDGSEVTQEDGNVHFDLDDDDDGLNLLDEIQRAIGQAELADASQKKTWPELRKEYLAIMDDDREIAQLWDLKKEGWEDCKKRIAENGKKRDEIMKQISELE